MAENNDSTGNESHPRLYPHLNPSPIVSSASQHEGTFVPSAPYPSQNISGTYPPQIQTCWFPECPPANPPSHVCPPFPPQPQPATCWFPTSTSAVVNQPQGYHTVSKPFNRFNAYHWVHTNSYSGVPPYAVRGGTDQDGTAIYVGRAFHEGDMVPAKVIPEKTVAYIAYGGEEVIKHQYEVLCEQRFEWMPNVGGNIPPGAVAGGNTNTGETLYIGRVYHEGSHTVGKIHPSHGSCYIPFNGEEIAYSEYEILCLRM